MAEHLLINVKGLTRFYGELRAVHEVSFELRRGEVLGFLGPNGAGKSTTMQMLCGALAPSAGQIEILGTDLLVRPKAAKAHLGFLPEQPPLYAELTVVEYLTFCARLRRVSTKGIRVLLDRVVQRCGLESVRSRVVGNLSKGFQQRVGIAQAIVHEPEVVILDEPTVGLDPIQIREIRTLIKELGQERGVILSTHVLPEVLATCNRVQIIHEGQLVFADSIENLDQHLPTRRLTIRLHKLPDLDAIAGIAGVANVAMRDDGRLELEIDPDNNPAEALAALAVSRDWGLLELVPEQRSLEQIFVALTSQENEEASVTA